MDIDLSNLPNVWRAESLTRSAIPHIASGYAELDALLDGGWPTPALIELLLDREGIGELTLLLPLLRTLLAAREGAVTLWLNPPHALHAIALAQQGLDPGRQWICSNLSDRHAAWAMELGLRSGACAAVLGWLQQPSTTALRRLKLSTSAGQTTAVLFRSQRAAQTPSPATVRLVLTPHATCLHLQLLKMQGRRQASAVIDLRSRLDGCTA